MRENLFVSYIKDNKIKFCLIVITIVFSSLLSIPLPFISKILIDNIILQEQYGYIVYVFLFFVIVLIIQATVGKINVKLQANFYQDFTNQMRKKFFLIFLKQESIDKHSLGNTQMILINDIEAMSSAIMSTVMVFTQNSILLIGYFVFLIYLSPTLTLVSLVFVPVYFIWTLSVSKKIKLLHLQLQENKDTLFKNVEINYNAFPVIKIYNYLKEQNQKFSKLVNSNSMINKRLMVFQNFIGIVSGIILSVANFLPLFIGLYFIKNGRMTIGMLIAFNGYSSQLFAPITALINTFPALKMISVYSSRINDFLSRCETRDESQKFIGKDNEFIELKEVSVFSNERSILSKVNLKIEKGHVIQLIGKNGTGKSLLMKVIMGVYNNYTGNILLQDEVIDNCSMEWKSCNFCYVSGEQGFLLDNIKCELSNKMSILDEEIFEVLKIVGLDVKIDLLEDRLLTDISCVLENFSSGELQRLRIARALTRKPKLLLLDEIFSNIDSEQAKPIFKKIRDAFPEMSIIFVEHHNSLEVETDNVFEIKDSLIFCK